MSAVRCERVVLAWREERKEKKNKEKLKGKIKEERIIKKNVEVVYAAAKKNQWISPKSVQSKEYRTLRHRRQPLTQKGNR